MTDTLSKRQQNCGDVTGGVWGQTLLFGVVKESGHLCVSRKGQRSWGRIWSTSDEWLRELRGLRQEKRMFRGDFIALYNSLMGGCRQVRGRFFSQVTGGEEIASGSSRGGLSWILGKYFH